MVLKVLSDSWTFQHQGDPILLKKALTTNAGQLQDLWGLYGTCRQDDFSLSKDLMVRTVLRTNFHAGSYRQAINDHSEYLLYETFRQDLQINSSRNL